MICRRFCHPLVACVVWWICTYRVHLYAYMSPIRHPLLAFVGCRMYLTCTQYLVAVCICRVSCRVHR